MIWLKKVYGFWLGLLSVKYKNLAMDEKELWVDKSGFRGYHLCNSWGNPSGEAEGAHV